ncbi:MAG: PIN domain-containing protein [Burkholderiales bacterium]|nr:PIN domain-containing protein [Burkholderiales bacterium]
MGAQRAGPAGGVGVGAHAGLALEVADGVIAEALAGLAEHLRADQAVQGIVGKGLADQRAVELLVVKKMLDKRSARLLPVTEAITLRTTELMESHTLSHGLQMGDALIAATALDHGLPVLTANVKHFSAVTGLTVEAFVP